MSTSQITLTPDGGLPVRVTSARLFHFYRGAWVVDCTLDLEQVQTAPTSGKVVLSLGGVSMTGTIDPRNTGTFGPSARVRVVAGGGGWDQVVPRQDFHNDAGVLSTVVYTATAGAVGEVVQELAPVEFGIDYERSTGPASRIFRDNPYWLDTNGITHVGDRIPSLQDPSLLVRDFDPERGLVTFSCDTLVVPFTPLLDTRFGTQSVTVFDVEQLFDANGSTGWAWVSKVPASNLVENLKSATLEWTRANYLRVQRYRLIQYQGNPPGQPLGPPRLALQAVTPSAGLPDIVPLPAYSGLAGAVNTLAPAQEVLVIFENADPTLPRIVGYSLEALPLKTSIDATVEVDVGATAPVVKLAKGTLPLTIAPWSQELFAILDGFAAALGSATTLPQVAAAGTALATGLTTLASPATVNTLAS